MNGGYFTPYHSLINKMKYSDNKEVQQAIELAFKMRELDNNQHLLRDAVKGKIAEQGKSEKK